jgi:hypothetical protein
MDANIEISRFNNYFFLDSLSNDMIYYTSSSNQHMLFGTESNELSIINMCACNIKLNRKIYIGAVEPYAPLLAQLEIADANSNNQFVIYENSNNKVGLYMNTSNGEARIGAYDWTINQSLHLLLQQSGSNIGIGHGVSNPRGLVHMRNNTTSNNIIIEAGRASDGSSEGLSAINFNRCTSNGNQRVNNSKLGWRFVVDQTSTNDYLGLDAYNGTSIYNYLTLSNANIGINTTNPNGRLHIVSSTINGSLADRTNSSNNPLTLYDTSGNAMRIIHLTTSLNDSTIYNYETGKNVYWGESTDNGMYAFRGRFVSMQSNLGIGHSNPNTLLHMNSNGSNFVKVTNSSNNLGIYFGIEEASASNGGGGLVWNASNAHLKFGTNNRERARILPTGKLTIGAVNPFDTQNALLEIADAGSNNQLVMYNNSNNKVGLYINTSNNMACFGGYNFTSSNAIHMSLQDSGSNLSIGKGVGFPQAQVHIRNDTTKNNILIESGRQSDGTLEGFSAINFNGNFNSIIDLTKTRWRILVDQSTTKDYMAIDNFDYSTVYSYATFSNKNVGINTTNPIARLHIRGTTTDGASADKTNSSNNPLTLEELGSGSLRIIHRSQNVNDSTTYNYEQTKNVFWGESNDGGIFAFRGKRVSILSNLGVNTTNPRERIHIDTGNFYISSSGNIISQNQLVINTSNQDLVMNVVSACNFIIRTSNSERLRIDPIGALLVGATTNQNNNNLIYASSNAGGGLFATLHNTNSTSSAFSGFRLLNDSSFTCRLSLNGTARTVEGGPNAALLLNEAGDMQVSCKNQNAYMYQQFSTSRTGINTSTPAATLDVNGTLKVGSTTSMGGTLTVNGDVVATSDRRLKDNIAPIKDALDKLKAISGYTYTMRNTTKKSIGLLAQEVIKVVPEAVSKNDDGYYGVAYGNMIGLIIEAIKELDEKIERIVS